MSGSSAAGLVALYCARWLEGLGDGRPEGGSPVLEGSLPFVCSGREVDPAASLYARELAWVSSPQGTLSSSATEAGPQSLILPSAKLCVLLGKGEKCAGAALVALAQAPTGGLLNPDKEARGSSDGPWRYGSPGGEYKSG